MARKQPLPLTAVEIDLAKRFNKWIGHRKINQFPSDSRGCQFTHKNIGDLADQYLFEHDGRVTLDGKVIERDQLETIVRRYRSMKAVATKRKRKAAEERLAKRNLREEAEKAKRDRKTREQEQAARQGVLAL